MTYIVYTAYLKKNLISFDLFDVVCFTSSGKYFMHVLDENRLLIQLHLMYVLKKGGQQGRWAGNFKCHYKTNIFWTWTVSIANMTRLHSLSIVVSLNA